MRVEELTFTRFVAAISIVVFHYGLDSVPFNFSSLKPFFTQANIGVSYFFVLSGYVMILAYGDSKGLCFYRYIVNRFSRIYPMYFIAILVLVPFLIVKNYYFNIPTFDFAGLFLNVFLLQSWVPGKALSINPPGWSLSVEMFFYLMFPYLLNRVLPKTKVGHLSLIILLIWLVTQMSIQILLNTGQFGAFPSKSHDLIFYFPLMHLNEFLIGALAGIYFKKYFIKKKNTDAIIIAVIILLAIVLWLGSCVNLQNGILAPFFVVILLLLSINNGFISTVFRNKLLVLLGETSYCIYILQRPIFAWGNGFFEHIGVAADQEVRFYSLLLTLMVVSVLSFHFIETPLRNKIKVLFSYN